jgi:small subunit ribosomal protein S9
MAQKKKTAVVQYFGTGRRKTSVARVIISQGSGNILVNGKEAHAYFPYELLITDLLQPLTLSGVASNYDVRANVNGGGFAGQAGAIRLGIARALEQASPETRALSKKNGLLTRDSRKKERKKPGLKAARRAPQFSKR